MRCKASSVHIFCDLEYLCILHIYQIICLLSLQYLLLYFELNVDLLY